MLVDQKEVKMESSSPLRKTGSLLWLFVTVVVGTGMLFFAVVPQSLNWFGIKADHEAIVFGSRVFLATMAWFIFGHNRVTKFVAEVEKSGPFAVLAIGILVGVILEGGKLVAILQQAGFGLSDMVLMTAGFLAIIGGIIWAIVSYRKPKNKIGKEKK